MFELVHAERERLPVAFSCRVLGVSRSGYRRQAPRSAQKASDARLSAEVRAMGAGVPGLLVRVRLKRSAHNALRRIAKAITHLIGQAGIGDRPVETVIGFRRNR